MVHVFASLPHDNRAACGPGVRGRVRAAHAGVLVVSISLNVPGQSRLGRACRQRVPCVGVSVSASQCLKIPAVRGRARAKLCGRACGVRRPYYSSWVAPLGHARPRRSRHRRPLVVLPRGRCRRCRHLSAPRHGRRQRLRRLAARRHSAAAAYGRRHRRHRRARHSPHPPSSHHCRRRYPAAQRRSAAAASGRCRCHRRRARHSPRLPLSLRRRRGAASTAQQRALTEEVHGWRPCCSRHSRCRARQELPPGCPARPP